MLQGIVSLLYQEKDFKNLFRKVILKKLHLGLVGYVLGCQLRVQGCGWQRKQWNGRLAAGMLSAVGSDSN